MHRWSWTASRARSTRSAPPPRAPRPATAGPSGMWRRTALCCRSTRSGRPISQTSPDEVLMAERTYLRPTGFVDAPFGHDGKVARLAGGLGWFASVELIGPDGKELVPVEGIEAR